MDTSSYQSSNPKTLDDIKDSTLIGYDSQTNSAFYSCAMKDGSTTMVIQNYNTNSSIMCDVPPTNGVPSSNLSDTSQSDTQKEKSK